MAITDPTPLTGAEQIKERIKLLQQQLQEQSPGYESLLHTIHVTLQKDEELVHLLSEEEIGVICSGLSKKKNVVIAAVSAKTGAGGKKLKNLDMDDL